MKLKRALIFSITLILIATTLLVTVLLIYSPLRYRAKMYSYCNDWISPAFLEANKVKGANYNNPAYDETQAWTEENPKYYRDQTAPSTRTYVITDEDTFHSIYGEGTLEVDFEKEMVLLHLFSSGYPRREYRMKKLELKGDALNIHYKMESNGNRKDYSLPKVKCLTVKMKKLDVSTVAFTEL